MYSRRKRVAVDPEPPVPTPSGSLLKDIVHAKLSTAVAFAFVLFAAGSVASMTAVAYTEIASFDEVSNVQVVMTHSRAQVLGEAVTIEPVVTVDDESLEVINPAVKIEAKSVSFNSNGRWNYKIGYKTKNFSGSGKITIGTHVVTDTVSVVGSVETGAILKPGMVYQVSFWGIDSSGVLQRLQSIEFKTAKAKSKKVSCENDLEKCPLIKGLGDDQKCTEGKECRRIILPCSTTSGVPCLSKPCPPGQQCLPQATGTPLRTE